jgi:ParB family chromosome partitioning protein
MVALTKPQDAFTPQGKSNNEWYTPSRYIEAARSVMGGIDLDPASCELANRTVQATRYYSKEDNGLTQEWHGNVWLNPPYGKIYGNISLMKLFLTKLEGELAAGRVQQAIVLATCDCDEKWFQLLWNGLICFTDHAVWFHRPNAANSKQFLGSIFAYLGPKEDTFTNIFSQFGPVAKRISPPPARQTQARTLWEAVLA